MLSDLVICLANEHGYNQKEPCTMLITQWCVQSAKMRTRKIRSGMWGEHDHTILRKRSQLGPLFIKRWDAGIIVPHPQAMNPSTDPKTLEICSTEYRGSRCCARMEEVIPRNDRRCIPLVTEWVRRARIGKVAQEVEPRTDGWDNPVDGSSQR